MTKKILSIVILSILVVGIVSACSPKTNAPAAGPNKPDPANPSAAYPATTKVAPEKPASPSTAYPAAEQPAAAKMTDEQIVALIEKQMDKNHTMDFLLEQKLTHDQWVEVFNKPEHSHLTFTPDELEQVIAYLIAHQK